MELLEQKTRTEYIYFEVNSFLEISYPYNIKQFKLFLGDGNRAFCLK